MDRIFSHGSSMASCQTLRFLKPLLIFFSIHNIFCSLRSFINVPILLGWDVARLGENGAALATGVTGLLLVDLSEPDEPVCLDLADTAGDAFGLTADGNMVYVGEGIDGMEIFSSEGCL